MGSRGGFGISLDEMAREPKVVEISEQEAQQLEKQEKERIQAAAELKRKRTSEQTSSNSFLNKLRLRAITKLPVVEWALTFYDWTVVGFQSIGRGAWICTAAVIVVGFPLIKQETNSMMEGGSDMHYQMQQQNYQNNQLGSVS